MSASELATEAASEIFSVATLCSKYFRLPDDWRWGGGGEEWGQGFELDKPLSLPAQIWWRGCLASSVGLVKVGEGGSGAPDGPVGDSPMAMVWREGQRGEDEIAVGTGRAEEQEALEVGGDAFCCSERWVDRPRGERRHLRQRIRWKATANSIDESIASLSTSLMIQIALMTGGGRPLLRKIGMRVDCERKLWTS
jgi:hypothetical protein